MNLVLSLLVLGAFIVLLLAVMTRGFEEMFEIRSYRMPPSRLRRCVHCGEKFDLQQSDGWKISGQHCTCNHCYWTGQRDADAAPGSCLGSPELH